jgi:NADPH-dependent curcumin reductase CurA
VEEVRHAPRQAHRSGIASRWRAKATDFRVEEYPVPAPVEGRVLLRTIWLSLDPYMRGRMSDAASYATPVPVGGVMEGGTVSEVIASNKAAFKKGEIVLSRVGWQTHAVSDGQGLSKIDPKLAPISTAVGVLGMPGMTAYFGLLDIGKPQPGETVVVAAASGAAGSAVGQIAKIKGARVIGIAGGKEKCEYFKKDLGFDDCLDHRDPNLAVKLKDACRKGGRRLLRKCRRRRLRCRISASQRFRARTRLWPDCALLRHGGETAEMGILADACDPNQAANIPGIYCHRFRRAPRRLFARHVAMGA